MYEAASRPGGGMRSEELTVPGAIHDVCSRSIHSPSDRLRSARSPRSGALADHGLEWVHSDVPLGTPARWRSRGVLHRSVDETAIGLGDDASAYRRLFDPFVEAGFDLTDGLLSPLHDPAEAPDHARSVRGGRDPAGAHALAKRGFDTDEGRALFAGLAGHSILSLKAPVTAGYGIMLGVLAHVVGWPLARGGSQQIADALVAVLEGLGGRLECDHRVAIARPNCPAVDAVLLDVTPRQVIALAGDELPARYAKTLAKFRYGPGVFKVDWALDGPIPWTNADLLPGGDGAPRRDARRDHGRRGRRTARPAPASGPTCCSHSRACSIAPARRSVSRRRGHTAMCRTGRRST